MIRKILVLGILVTLISTSFTLICGAKVIETLNNEIIVDKNGGGDYTTIQEAINNVESEFTIIRVKSGVYNENIIINYEEDLRETIYGLQIIGDGAFSTVIDGQGNGNVVTIGEMNPNYPYSSVFISGFTLKNSGSDYAGVYIENSDAATIKENTICDNGFGVLADVTSAGNEIYHNNFINNVQNAYNERPSIWCNAEINEGNYWDDYTGTDSDDDGIGEDMYGIPPYSISYDMYPFISENGWLENRPPSTPAVTGIQSGKTGNEYTYTASSTDPDGDEIEYLFDWDDGSDSGWQSSNTADHTWNSDDTYTVKVKAKDAHGAESGWGTLEVTMPKTANSIIDFLENRLDRFDWPFPMLRVMLWALGK